MNTFLNQVIKTAREFPFIDDDEVVRIAGVRTERELNPPYQGDSGIFDDLLMTGQVKIVDGKMVKNPSTISKLGGA